eukprot:m.37820 g.37820  ORF g.37820 m.37820 type:complete len:50 (+) comp10132_c0_seq2:3442-3591(+)
MTFFFYFFTVLLALSFALLRFDYITVVVRVFQMLGVLVCVLLPQECCAF